MTVVKEALARFGITARQFNGVRFDLDRAVNGWRGTAEYRVSSLKDAMEGTSGRIAGPGKQVMAARPKSNAPH